METGGEKAKMGFQFKPKLASVMAVLNSIAFGASYVVSQGNLEVTVIVTANGFDNPTRSPRFLAS